MSLIDIKIATTQDVAVLSLLGRVTYTESHGDFIENSSDLLIYNNNTFSIAKLKEEINNKSIVFYLVFVDELPVGYAKITLNKSHKNITTTNNCCLDKIYILNDFISMKLGQKLLNFVVNEVEKLQFQTLWLSVYVKNNRAIRFYQKNDFKDIGITVFTVNQKEYPNIVFAKNIKS